MSDGPYIELYLDIFLIKITPVNEESIKLTNALMQTAQLMASFSGNIPIVETIRELRKENLSVELTYSNVHNLQKEKSLTLYAEKFLPKYKELVDEGLIKISE